MGTSDETVFALAITKAVLIVSSGFSIVVYLAWAGAKRTFMKPRRSEVSKKADLTGTPNRSLL